MIEEISQPEAEVPKSAVVREQPQPEESVAALVTRWTGKIRQAKAHWKKDFDKMVDSMRFASGDQWNVKDSDNYRCNIVQRHIQQKVAALYAKNPKTAVRKRKRMEWKLWDGTMQQLQLLQQQIAQSIATGMLPPPDAVAKLADIAQGTSNRVLHEKIAETLELICDWTQDNQVPPLKLQLKQLVRRTCIAKVGWLKLGYQRLGEKRPEDHDKITGITEQIAAVESLSADAVDGEMQLDAAEAETLRTAAEVLAQPDAIVQEGLSFDFPDSRSVILDPATKHLRTLSGTGWIVHEFRLPADTVQEIYGVDLRNSGAVPYKPEEKKPPTTDGECAAEDNFCVWEVWDKRTGSVFTIAEGHADYLRPPAPPLLKTDRFWLFFPLTFNDLEADGEDVSIYPISDVEILMPMQREYNRAREGLRRHRAANVPRVAVPKGMLEDSDIDILKSGDPLGVAVLQLNALQPGQKVEDLLQPVIMPAIDPAKYDTEMIFSDVQRSTGSQEANLGGNSGGTATESSIAESSRMTAMASNIDDLDDFLSEVWRAAGQILLLNMSKEKAVEIVGPGAVWPEMEQTAQEIADELILEIEAGSSGRPNKAAEIANMEKIVPLLLQIPGISPDWLARQLIRRLDDTMDPTDAIVQGIPSILTMAQMQLRQVQAAGQGPAAPQQGDGSSNPNMQGPQGGANTPALPGRAGTEGGNPDALGGFAAD